MLTDHLDITLIIDTLYQARVSSIEVSAESGDQAVQTLEGLAGFTSGPGQLTVSFTAVVPLGGPEFDIMDAVAKKGYHEIQIPFGPKSVISKGKFLSGSMNRSTGQGTELRGEFTGELVEPK